MYLYKMKKVDMHKYHVEMQKRKVSRIVFYSCEGAVVVHSFAGIRAYARLSRVFILVAKSIRGFLIFSTNFKT